jgi:hypothetical protein
MHLFLIRVNAGICDAMQNQEKRTQESAVLQRVCFLCPGGAKDLSPRLNKSKRNLKAVRMEPKVFCEFSGIGAESGPKAD